MRNLPGGGVGLPGRRAARHPGRGRRARCRNCVPRPTAGVVGGQYYGPPASRESRGYPKVVGSSKKSHDADVRQRRLWAVSEELTGVTYPV